MAALSAEEESRYDRCQERLTYLDRMRHGVENAMQGLGDICRVLSRLDFRGRKVGILDMSFSHGKRKAEEDLTLVPPGSPPCPTCYEVPGCVNSWVATALVTLLVYEGASPVSYRRLPILGPFRQNCRDVFWDDSLGVIIANGLSAPSLMQMLEPQQFWQPLPRLKEGEAKRCERPLPSEAFEATGSDKGRRGHNYVALYDMLFKDVKCSVRSVLEVGIGTISPGTPSNMAGWASSDPRWQFPNGSRVGTYRPGASLRGWREVFPQAHITGLDVDRAAMLGGPRIRTHVVNTLNASRIREVLQGRTFDLMIEDGLHTEIAQQITLHGLWPHLRHEGLYVIEDVGLERALHFMDIMQHSVVINPGIGGFTEYLVLMFKRSEHQPLPKVKIPNFERDLADCLGRFGWVDFDGCCGRGGTFLPERSCFGGSGMRVECCTVYTLARDPVFIDREKP